MGRKHQDFSRGLKRVLRQVNVVTCDAEDGTGCKRWWVEDNGSAYKCPWCGKDAVSGNVIVNDDTAPNVMKLHDRGVLVVGDERCLRATEHCLT